MKRLIVSIHDVTPAHTTRIERALSLLGEYGVLSVALFVVPNWHGSWPLERHADFAARLRALAAQGCEILLHGVRHDEFGGRRSAGEALRAFGRTAREAEFLLLEDAAAAERLRQGREALGAVGLDPIGFVPPAWLYRSGLIAVLRAQGFGVMEDAWAVIEVPSGRRVRVPCVHWSTRKWYRAAAGVAIARVRVPLERGRAVLRLGIHPPDVEHPAVSRSLRWTLERLLETRRVVSYREAMGVEGVM